MKGKLSKRQKRLANKQTNYKASLPKAKPLGVAGHIAKQKKHTYVSKADCHTGHNLIFKTVEGIEVWAGGKSRDGGWHKMLPLPALAMGPSETLGTYKLTEKTEVPEGWLCAKIIETDPSSKVCFITKRTSTKVPVIPPLLN